MIIPHSTDGKKQAQPTIQEVKEGTKVSEADLTSIVRTCKFSRETRNNLT